MTIEGIFLILWIVGCGAVVAWLIAKAGIAWKQFLRE